MNTNALTKELEPVDLKLDWIYLDPNNPRFVGQNWRFVPDAEIAKESVQENTRQVLEQKFSVDKPKMNMEVNGYLPIDRVIVRKFGESKYVVLEGNRRICAAKIISQSTPDDSPIPEDVLDSFRVIPCLKYTGSEEDASWIFQGLRHISGLMDWSSFNKAKLLVEQMEVENLNLTEVGKRFGLTAHGAGQWVRGYYAFKQAREESDFINEIDERSYSYFQELFSRSNLAMRDWLEWNENDMRFKSALNFNEFVSWLYPRPGEDEEDGSKLCGDWERRILRRVDDIRQVSFLLRSDKESFDKFLHERDLEKVYSETLAKKYEREARESYDVEAEVFKAITECTKAIVDIPHRLLKDSGTKDRLLEALKKLKNAISDLDLVDENED